MRSQAGYVRELEDRRAQEQERLRGFPSVLAAVARYELPIGAPVRVRASDGDVVLPEMDRDVTIEALPDGFVVNGERTGPGMIDAGRYGLRLSHQGYPAIVVLDRKAVRRVVELRWYPVDPELRVHGRIERDDSRIAIGSTASPDRPAERVGWFLFVRDGAVHRLAVTRLLEPGAPEDHLDVYFRDATTGRDSYAVGRYVTVERERDGAIVDFNLAYNPSCALSPYYNCPIPPAENHLAIPIRAGEMTPLVRDRPGH